MKISSDVVTVIILSLLPYRNASSNIIYNYKSIYKNTAAAGRNK